MHRKLVSIDDCDVDSVREFLRRNHLIETLETLNHELHKPVDIHALLFADYQEPSGFRFTGRQIEFKANVIACRFHPNEDGVYAVATGDKKLWIALDATQNICIDLDAIALDIEFHPTDSIIAAGTMDGHVHLLEYDGTKVQSMHDNSIKYVLRSKWSLDGTLLATASNDHRINIYRWDSKNRGLSRVRTFTFDATPEAMHFTQDRLVYSIRGDNYLHFIDLETLQEHSRLNMNSMNDDFVSFNVLNLKIDQERGFIAASTDRSRTILLHPSANGPVRDYSGALHDEYSAPRTSFYAEGNGLVSTSQDGRIVCWDVATAQIVDELTHHSRLVRDLDYQDGILLSGSYDHTVALSFLSEIP